MPTIIRKARKFAGDATRKASGVATEVALRAVGGLASKAAGEAGKLAIKLDRSPIDPGAVKVDVRKIVTLVEEIRHEGGPRAKKPHLRGAIAAVVANPFAGRYVEDLTPMMDALKPLGVELAAALIKALGGPRKVDAYGKSVIVGVAGESEHAALWHVPGGYGMRELLDRSLAIVPSTIKVAAAGAGIDVPLHHRTAAYVRSHFDSIEMRVPDAPRPNEIVFILAMGVDGRVHERMGGLTAYEIAKFDGQR